MKTIFKEGMKVYDQVFFPDVDGRIVEIHNKNNKIQLEVKFFSKYRLEPLCMQSSVFYTEKGNMINFLGGYNCGTSTLSTEPYKLEMQGFEQKSSTPTYEDAVKWVESNNNYNPAYVEINEKEKVFLSETYFYAFEALRKLIILRDYYNEGWQPDWNNSGFKQCIELEGKVICGRDNAYSSRVLAFKSGEIRDKFLDEQKELLEIAKPLL